MPRKKPSGSEGLNWVPCSCGLTRLRGRSAGRLKVVCSHLLVVETCAHCPNTDRHTSSDTLRKQHLSKSTGEHAASTHPGEPKATLGTHGESTQSTMSVPQRMKRIEQKQEQPPTPNIQFHPTRTLHVHLFDKGDQHTNP